MKPKPKRFVGLIFIMVAVLSEVAAFIPMIGERPPNVVFMGVGVVFLVLGLARIRASKNLPDDPAT